MISFFLFVMFSIFFFFMILAKLITNTEQRIYLFLFQCLRLCKLTFLIVWNPGRVSGGPIHSTAPTQATAAVNRAKPARSKLNWTEACSSPGRITRGGPACAVRAGPGPAGWFRGWAGTRVDAGGGAGREVVRPSQSVLLPLWVSRIQHRSK